MRMKTKSITNGMNTKRNENVGRVRKEHKGE